MFNPFGPIRARTTRIFDVDATWICPAGVTQVKATCLFRRFPQIAAQSSTFHLIDFEGTPWGCGSSANGEIGNAAVISFSNPTDVSTTKKFRSWAQGCGGITLGIDAWGDAYAWGLNDDGQLGVGGVVPRSTPTAVNGGLKWKQLAKGGNTGTTHCLGITTDGTPYAWGLNLNGQLGLGDVTPRSSPVAVLGSLKFKQIIAGGRSGGGSSLGLTFDGRAYAWGFNDRGQLGTGDVTPRSSPVAVVGNLRFKQVAITGNGNSPGTSMCGITPEGVAYAWGSNIHGQLGTGDVVDRSSPTLVLGGLRFKQIAASNGFHAVTANGTGYGWGLNEFGQLGLGDITPRSSPVAMVGSYRWSHIVGGGDSAYGVATDAKAYGWGRNQAGQLGDQTVTSRSSPVAMVFVIPVQAFIEGTKSSVFIDVVPGQSYPITLMAQIANFDGIPIDDDPAVLHGIALEY